MKIFFILPFIFFITACASSAPSQRFEVDVKKLEANVNLFEHKTNRLDGSHMIQAEHDQIYYKVKYVF